MTDTRLLPESDEVQHTPTPWFVSGIRFRMNGCEWQSVHRYDEALKRDENVACVGYDPRTGAGLADAHFIVKAVNSHDALVKALEEAINVFGGMNDDEIDVELLPRLRAALAPAVTGSERT